jgi:hypothetical protein
MPTSVFLLEIIKSIDGVGDNSTNILLTMRKITNRLFNNSFTKNRMPISSPEFISAFTEDMILPASMSSFLSSCYYYSIPVFISDVQALNYVCASEIDSNYPLLSSQCDWGIYSHIVSGNSSHFVLANHVGHSEYLDLDLDLVGFYAGIDVGYPKYKEVKSCDLIGPMVSYSEVVESGLYDKFF